MSRFGCARQVSDYRPSRTRRQSPAHPRRRRPPCPDGCTTPPSNFAERFDQLTEGDLDHRLDQLCGFHPAIGRGERGTAITISLIADGPDEAGEVVRTLNAQRANPNQVDIVNSTVLTTEEFDRANGIERC
ncbi:MULTISPECIES: hypothetical protein [Rhodococcus]|uniref:Uncharacterized protein n=1 Tax=Rhodococcus opacus RKJ300 = JCM 13270 TaxID=1165867 RepID=I0WPD3_RHOOP|nr:MULTISPECIES: hypothetical protein [Rhodococcus]EID78249.1 hypothetical protein W59_19428 [Rhodococcus opacus RKJ300 = JCM 13270]QQZ18238.1 hypothetical protein GO592_38995 [Rhodococcus sp. 21391]